MKKLGLLLLFLALPAQAGLPTPIDITKPTYPHLLADSVQVLHVSGDPYIWFRLIDTNLATGQPKYVCIKSVWNTEPLDTGGQWMGMTNFYYNRVLQSVSQMTPEDVAECWK